MTHPFLARAWEAYPTSRPVDWAIREAATAFLQAVASRERSSIVEARAAKAFRSALASNDPQRLMFACFLIEGLSARIEPERALLQRCSSLLRDAEVEREIALLEAQSRHRSEGQ